MTPPGLVGTWLLAGLAGVVAGLALSRWLRRDGAARSVWRDLRRQRRRDRVREAVVSAQEGLVFHDRRRALRRARRALRLDGSSAEAHAAMAACRSALEHHGQALVHHRRAEELGSRGTWRVENALDAAAACLHLREEAREAEAQALWDEAHAWMRLAHDLDPDEAEEAVERSPRLAELLPGEVWLRP